MTREEVQAGARERESDFQGFLAELGDEGAQRQVEIINDGGVIPLPVVMNNVPSGREVVSGRAGHGGESVTDPVAASRRAAAALAKDQPMYTGRAGGNYSSRPCFAYQKGQCTRGDQCRYTHTGDVPQQSFQRRTDSRPMGRPAAQERQERQAPRKINSGPIEILGAAFNNREFESNRGPGVGRQSRQPNGPPGGGPGGGGSGPGGSGDSTRTLKFIKPLSTDIFEPSLTL